MNHANFLCHWLYLIFEIIVTFCLLAKLSNQDLVELFMTQAKVKYPWVSLGHVEAWN